MEDSQSFLTLVSPLSPGLCSCRFAEQQQVRDPGGKGGGSLQPSSTGWFKFGSHLCPKFMCVLP